MIANPTTSIVLPRDSIRLIKKASEGDEESVAIIHNALKMQSLIKVIFDNWPLRDALLIIGRYYGEAKLISLEKIFGLDHTRIARITSEDNLVLKNENA